MGHEINLHPRHAQFTRHFAGGPVAHRVKIEDLQVLGLDLPTHAGQRGLHDVPLPLDLPFRGEVIRSGNALDGGRPRGTAIGGRRGRGGGRIAPAKLIGDAPAREVEQPALERAARRVKWDTSDIADDHDGQRLLHVNEALDRLALQDPGKAEIVKHRFFAGLENREIAEMLGISERTVERAWRFAKAWLLAEFNEG